MPTDLTRLLEKFREVAEGSYVSQHSSQHNVYAISIFRGGIGKSTLAFNLAFQVSREVPTLLVDVCPQCNFTQSLLGDDVISNTVYDALLPRVMAGTEAVSPANLLVSVPPACTAFKYGKPVYAIPGSKELFLFPSLLYTQLSTANNLGSRSRDTSRNILQSIKTIVSQMQNHTGAQKVLIDTSPFFGGATHLAWVAADALIIPVRVDQHSMEALKLTLAMLRDEHMDFIRLNRQAGIESVPKVHAIALTHCGWNRQQQFTPDRSTQAYMSAVIDIVKENSDLFSSGDPVKSIHLLDDFHSAGRISGSRRIPLAKLNVGDWRTIEGQRLEVNQSLTRYQNELGALAASI